MKIVSLFLMKIVSLLISLIITSWCLGFFYFTKTTSEISNYNRDMTDAIVIFGEKKQRIYAGTQLLKMGYAPLVFITSDKPKSDFTDFFKTHRSAPEQFIFDTALAKNTINHAADTAEFLKKYKLHSIRLVVDAIELPRAMLEITSKVPSNIIIIPHPVLGIDKDYDLIMIEYIKYTITLIAQYIGYKEELNLSYP